MRRALFLAPYPRHAASTRFRVAQYFPFLEQHGLSCQLAPLLSEKQFVEFYAPTGRADKAAKLVASAIRQTLRALASRRFDVVVVQRGALLFGPPLLEWLIARVARVPIVFDYDDAIWLQDPVSSWGYLARLTKFPSKVSRIIRLARHVITCNQFTRDYALRFRQAADVSVIPTVVDSDAFRPNADARSSALTVGWIGTHTTAEYLSEIAPALSEVAKRREYVLKIVGAGREWAIPDARIVTKRWRLEDEVTDYQSLDVGLYPVRDDAWGRGKTGFKPIVYMSCGAVCLASPVGGVTEFLVDGVNGMTASTYRDWVEGLETLIADDALRSRLAEAGRETVESEYCLRVQAPRLHEILMQACEK